MEHKIEYYVLVDGVFGRNRTAKRKVCDVLEVDAVAPLPDETALDLARGIVAGLRCKPGTRWALRRNAVEVEHHPREDEHRPAWVCRKSFPFAAVTIWNGQV